MSIWARRCRENLNNDRLQKIMGNTFLYIFSFFDACILEDTLKRAILGAQESAKIDLERYLELSYRCFGAIKSSRCVQDSTKITPGVFYQPNVLGGNTLLGLS